MKHLKSFKIFNESLNSKTSIFYFLSTNPNFEDIEDEFLKFRDMRCLFIHPINKGIYKHFIKIDLRKDPELKPWLDQILNSKSIVEKLGLKLMDLWVKEEFLDKFIIKTEEKKYPGYVFYLIGDKVYLELEKKNSILWCRWTGFWTIFSMEFHMENSEIQYFIKDLVEEHLKLKGVTPLIKQAEQCFRWRNISN